jgi:hypothetical protein
VTPELVERATQRGGDDRIESRSGIGGDAVGEMGQHHRDVVQADSAGLAHGSSAR